MQFNISKTQEETRVLSVIEDVFCHKVKMGCGTRTVKILMIIANVAFLVSQSLNLLAFAWSNA